MKLNFIKNLFKKPSAENIEIPTKKIKRNKLFDEDDSKAYIESGKLKASKKNYREAIDDFTTAIELDPSSIIGYMERSKAKTELNDKSGADKDLATGRRLFDNVDNGLKANDDGNAAYDEGDYKNAIKFYNKAIPLIPTITSIYYYRGCAKRYLEDYRGAIEDFNKSIELGASNMDDSYYQSSKIKSHIFHEKDGALQDINKAIELNPNDAEYYSSRAILVDDYDALQDLNSAIELAPKEADNYIARSLGKQAMEDLEGSIDDLTTYIELNPTDSLLTVSEAYSLRAGMKLFQNELESALKDHNKAVESDRLNEKALVERGIVKDLLQDFNGAIIDYDKAIELNPKYADAYYHRGLVKQNIGKEDDGASDVIRAKALGFEE